MTRKEILTAAIECVCRDRKDKHGNAEDNFKIIADLWNAYLRINKISSKDVAVMMCLLKCARIRTGNGNADNWIDLAGYAACGGEIEENEP